MLDFAIFVVVVSMLLALYRLLRGPTLATRLIATDVLGVDIVVFIVLMGMKLNTQLFIDAAVLIAIVSFIGTCAGAKYLYGGVIIDRNRD